MRVEAHSAPAPLGDRPEVDAAGRHAAPHFAWRLALVACAGVFLAIGSLDALGTHLGVMLLLGSFGSSAVMLFAFPDLHFSQPRSVIGGHVISTAVGLAALHAFGPGNWVLGGAAACALALMMVTRTVHPPAGSNPIIVFLAQPSASFLLFPTAVGALAMVALALAYHRSRGCRYPRYWR